MMFRKLMYATTELDRLADFDWKNTIIICTIGAFVVGCIIAIRQIKKDFDSGKFDETEKSKKGGKKNGV